MQVISMASKRLQSAAPYWTACYSMHSMLSTLPFLQDVDDDVRELAALTLLAAEAEAGSHNLTLALSEATLPYRHRLLRTAVRDSTDYVQAAAIRVLEALSGRLAATDFAQDLADGLKDESVSARWGALKALRAMGVAAVGRAASLEFRDRWSPSRETWRCFCEGP